MNTYGFYILSGAMHIPIGIYTRGRNIWEAAMRCLVFARQHGSRVDCMICDFYGDVP